MENKYSLSEEHKRKIGLSNSISLKGKHCSPRTEWKKGMIAWNKGKLFSEETKRKMSLAKIGTISNAKGCHHSESAKYPMGLLKDKVRTEELVAKGFKVLRLWESDIKQMNLEEFKEKLK